jgi:hypothetical protein
VINTDGAPAETRFQTNENAAFQMLRSSERKASFHCPIIPISQPEPIQRSKSSPPLPPPAANHFVQETSLIGFAMRKVLSIFSCMEEMQIKRSV